MIPGSGSGQSQGPSKDLPPLLTLTSSPSLSSSPQSYPSSVATNGKRHQLTVQEYYDLMRQIFPVLPKKQYPHPCYTWLRGSQDCLEFGREDKRIWREYFPVQSPSVEGEVMMSDDSSGGNPVDDDQGQSISDQEQMERYLRRHPFMSHDNDHLLSHKQEEQEGGMLIRPLTSSLDIQTMENALERERERQLLASLIGNRIQQQDQDQDRESFSEDETSTTGHNLLHDDKLQDVSQRLRIMSSQEELSSQKVKHSPSSSGFSSMTSSPKSKAPKRAYECLRRCIQRGMIHAVQCHSIC